MNKIESIHSTGTERQICARIQHFYDFMAERRNHQSDSINPEDIFVEEELDQLMTEFSKIFCDIVYVEN